MSEDVAQVQDHPEESTPEVQSEEAQSLETPEQSTEQPAEQKESSEGTNEYLFDKADTTSEKETQTPEEGAPETYEEFTYGEGLRFTKDGMSNMTGVFKELNLSQEKAQKIVDSFVPMQVAANKEMVLSTSKRWAEATKKDPEIGGEHFEENIGVASAAYREFASPELQNLLKESGLGNHPEIVRMFVKLGKEMSQDKGVRGEGSDLVRPNRSLYPNSNMVKA